MYSFPAPVPSIFNGILGLPKSIWYGLGAGVFSGLLWTLDFGVVQSTGLPAAMGPQARVMLGLCVFLSPIIAILVTSVRLGAREGGAVVDGLIADYLASLAFTGIVMTIYLIMSRVQLVASARADRLGPSVAR